MARVPRVQGCCKWLLLLAGALAVGALPSLADDPGGVQRYSSVWLARQQARPQRTEDIPPDFGWTVSGDLPRVEGSVRVLERGTEPWVLMHEAGFDADAFNVVRLRMRVSEGVECTLAWEEATRPAAGGRASVSLPLKPGPDIQEYTFDFTALETPFWTGRIARFWLSPSDRPSRVEILGCSLGLAHPAMARPVTIGHRTHEAFRGSQPAWTLTVPPRGVLEASVGVLPGPQEVRLRNGAHFVIRLEEGGSATTLVDTQVAPAEDPSRVCWASVQADLSAYAGKRVQLTLTADPLNPASECYAFWGNPMVFSLGEEPESGPVILISCDTTRADHLSCYGYERQTTPYLDAWTREAVLFEKAVTTSTWTLPSHMSMFTGLIEEHHKVGGDQVLAVNIPTLAEGLRGRGYVTAAFTGYAGVLQPEWGPGRGFDLYDAPPNAARSVFGTLNNVKAWLHGRQRSKFFLFFHNFDMHGFHVTRLPVMEHKALEQIPYSPADSEYLHFTKAYRIPSDSSPELDRWAAALCGTKPIDSPIESDLLQCGIAGYDDAILSVDSALHDFFEYLKSLNLYDASTIIVAADHGEEFGEHGRCGHYTAYEECCWVPLLIKFPHGQFAGQRYPRMVQLIDLFPTVFDLLGAPLSRPVDGESLLGPLKMQTELRDLALIRSRCQMGARTNAWKAVVDNEGKGFRYFDLARDPKELEDRATEQRDALDILLSALGNTEEKPPPNPLDEGVPQPRKLSEAEKDQLRAIGYLDADLSSPGGAPEAQSGAGLLSALVCALIDGNDFVGASKAIARIPRSNLSIPQARERVFGAMMRGLAAPECETAFFAACRTALAALPPSADTLRLSGQFALKQNDAGAASADYLAALALAPYSSEMQRLLVSAIEKMGTTDDALNVSRKAQELAPENPALRLCEAGILESREDLNGALAVCRNAREQCPGNGEVWRRLGALLQRTGSYEEALHAFQKAESINGRDCAAVLGLAGVMEALGNIKGAVTAYQKVTELDPNRMDAWLGLGDDLRRLNDLEGAQEAVRKARALDPHNLEAAMREIDLIEFRGDVPGAVTAYRTLTEEHPDDAGLLRRMAALLERNGDVDGAFQAIHKAQEIDPKDVRNVTIEGHLQTVRGDAEAAMATYRKAAKLQPDNVDVWMSLAAVLQKQGATDEALEALRKVRTIKPENAGAWFNEGLILSSREDVEGAVAALTKASELQPGDINIWLCLGDVLRRNGKFDKAASALKKAIAIDPVNAAALNASARNAQAQGKWAEAAEWCRKSIQARPRDIFPKQLLAEALEQQGDFKGVLDTLLELLKINATGSQPVEVAARVIEAHPDTPGALDFARTLMPLRPRDGRPHWFAGIVLHGQGDLGGAIVELENALSVDPSLEKASQLLEATKKERRDEGK